MKAVLISIKPKWCEKIANGKKTVEVRKNKPNLQTPFKAYIYCTNGFVPPDTAAFTHGWRGYVIGELVCDRITPIRVFDNGTIQDWNWNSLKDSCVSYDDIVMYIGNGKNGYGWHISKLAIYDEPKPLSEFIKPCENDLYCESCAMHSEFLGKCGNKALVISRPPQSWCYVEVFDA